MTDNNNEKKILDLKRKIEGLKRICEDSEFCMKHGDGEFEIEMGQEAAGNFHAGVLAIYTPELQQSEVRLSQLQGNCATTQEQY